MPTRATQTSYIKYRIILAVLIPLVASALLSTWLITSFSHGQLTSQSRHYGQAIADQLAINATDYLVSNDILSLNVVLDDLLTRNNFNFAAMSRLNAGLRSSLHDLGRRPRSQAA